MTLFAHNLGNGVQSGVQSSVHCEHLPVFCDWLSLTFPTSGLSVGFDKWVKCESAHHGVHWHRPAWVDVRDARTQEDQRASDSTLIRVRARNEGTWLDVDGNLGRWGRRDNVWGSSVYAAAWPFLDHLHRHHAVRVASDPEVRRVDLTLNLCFDSVIDAYAWRDWAAGLRLARILPTVYRSGNPAWVTENWSAKVYDKIEDLRRHNRSALAEAILDNCGYLLRLETTIRTGELERLGLRHLSNWQDGETIMDNIIRNRFAPLLNGGRSVDECADKMPVRLSNALEAWRNGRNFQAALMEGRISRPTYYRLRRDLLVYGIDIAIPCTVTRLNIKPREVIPMAIAAPDWYRQVA